MVKATEDAARAIRRGEYFLQRMSMTHAPRSCRVQGKVFDVYPGVFSPALSRSTQFLVDHLLTRVPGLRVLEIGCGTGAAAVLCALAGASEVVCTDISASALACARANVARYGVGARVRVLDTPLPSAADGCFDIIYFALPYVYINSVAPLVEKYGPLAHSIFDERYATQKFFFTASQRLVARGGEIFAEFSAIGDIDRFHRNARAAKLAAELIAKKPEGRTDNRLYRLIPLRRSRSSSKNSLCR